MDDSAIDLKEFRIVFSKIREEARRRIDQTKCLICGGEMTSACNSHTVPRFILNYIADNGCLATLHDDNLALNAILNDKVGINKADTFYAICRHCDQQVFSIYESEEKLLAFPSMNKTDKTKLLSAIYMKINLDNYYKKYYLKATEEVTKEYAAKMNGGQPNFGTNSEVEDLDMKESRDDVIRCKRYIDENYHAGFKVLYFKLLPYRISVACQIHLSPESDLEGNLINDLYNPSPAYRIVTMCLCLFPLKEKSFVLLFARDQDIPRLSRFIKQFNSLKEARKQSLLFAMGLTLSEDMFYSSKLKNILERDPLAAVALGESLPLPFGLLPNDDLLIRKAPSCSLRDYLALKNYLSSEYAIKE